MSSYGAKGTRTPSNRLQPRPDPRMPEEMRDPSLDHDDWLGWRPIASTVTDEDLDRLEQRIDLAYPPPFCRQLLEDARVFGNCCGSRRTALPLRPRYGRSRGSGTASRWAGPLFATDPIGAGGPARDY
jgi:hypothetical protein